MYQEFKVKVFIFAGREKTMQLLMPQLQSKYIDEIIIAKNTKNETDLKYLDGLHKNFEKIRYIDVPQNLIGSKGWRYLYRYMMEEDTIYIKMDDDIVYLSDDFFENLLKFRVENPEYFCVFPMCVNNSYCATLHKNSKINELNCDLPNKMIEYFFNGKYAIAEHNLFLENPKSDIWKIGKNEFGKEVVVPQKTNKYEKLNYYALFPRPQICCVCFFGKVFKLLKLLDDVGKENDEHVFTYHVFNKIPKAKNIVIDDCLVCHYAFSKQKDEIDKTNILERYKKLVKNKG